MTRYVGAVDQGTTSTRFMIFDHGGREVARHQLEHGQILPQAGWVEHDALEIYRRTGETIEGALANGNLKAEDLAAVGVTNQRETTVVWNPKTGAPLYNAIVWQDTRTDRIMRKLEQSGAGKTIQRKAGLPPATYFSGGKIQWILDNVDGARSAAERGEAIFGNIDTWVIWNLTGGINGGAHITDVTNASRTMLFNLETLDWDDELLGFFGIPRSMLPVVRPSSDSTFYGMTLRTDHSRVKFRCAPIWATNKPQLSGRFASLPAKRRTPMALATSCFSIPVRTSSRHTPACSQRFVTSWVPNVPFTRSRARWL